MRSEKIAMATATFTRLGLGLAVFVVMARFLGPEQFGIIATAIAYSGLLNLLGDFGLGTFALRLAGAEQHRNTEIVRRALLIKMVTTIPATLVGAVLLLAFKTTGVTLEVQILIFVAVTLASFADLSFVVVRSVGKLWIEARTVVATSIISLVFVAWVAMATGDVVATSWAFLATRLVYMLAAAWALRDYLLDRAAPWPTDMSELKTMARNAVPYATDGALTTLSNQIDVVMVSLMLDAASVGIYQAGARLVQSISPLAVILSTVYLPKLAQAHHTGDQANARQLARRLNIEFAGLAVLGFLGFLIVGPLWTEHVYGARYAALVALWPGFAVFAGTRFITASFGLQLVARGDVKWRIIGQTVSILTVIAAFFIARNSMTTLLSVWIVALSSVILILIYAAALYRGKMASRKG